MGSSTAIKRLGSIIGQLTSNKSTKLSITMDEVAELLKDNPELLHLFEEKYTQSLKEKEKTHAPVTDSKQMTSIVNAHQQSNTSTNTDTTTGNTNQQLTSIIQNIVKDLINLTEVYEFDGDLGTNNGVRYITNSSDSESEEQQCTVTPQDLESIEKQERPQLTANAVVKDINTETGLTLLWHYKKAVEKMGTKEGLQNYHRFRQGLDILDLDELSYIMLDQNRNSMSHWLPQLVEASVGQEYFRIPKTTIAKLPLTLLQLTRLEYNDINQTTRKILNTWAKQVFNLSNSGDYFIKTGTYSFKFDFRNVRVREAKEIDELGEYLLYIHSFANQMAGPLYNPCTYGMSTTTEWVVRDFIESKEESPTIYNGLPLHVEYRVFIDCDTHEILSIHPYWDPEGMKKHFSRYAKDGNINNIHDYVVFKSYEDKMIQKYEANKGDILKHLKPIVEKLSLKGQWSLDIMDDGEQLWLIDMAVAEQSTFYESVPEDKRKPVLEQWVPGVKPVMPPYYNTKLVLPSNN